MTASARRLSKRTGAVFLSALLILITAFGCQSMAQEPADGDADTITSPDTAQMEDRAERPVQNESSAAGETDNDTGAAPGPAEPDDMVDAPAEVVAPAFDLNNDGVLDGGDRDVFANALHTRGDDPGFEAALDFDGDSLVSLVDYQIWYNLVFAAE